MSETSTNASNERLDGPPGRPYKPRKVLHVLPGLTRTARKRPATADVCKWAGRAVARYRGRDRLFGLRLIAHLLNPLLSSGSVRPRYMMKSTDVDFGYFELVLNAMDQGSVEILENDDCWDEVSLRAVDNFIEDRLGKCGQWDWFSTDEARNEFLETVSTAALIAISPTDVRRWMAKSAQAA